MTDQQDNRRELRKFTEFWDLLRREIGEGDAIVRTLVDRVSQELTGIIQNRVQQENRGSSGATLESIKPYNPTYAQKKAERTGDTSINLTVSGDMFSAFTSDVSSSDNKHVATLFFDDSVSRNAAAKAAGNEALRPLIAPTDEELDWVVNEIVLGISRAIESSDFD